MAPPAGALSRIESRLFGAAPATGGWWNSLALWRGLTAAAAAVAVVAIGVNLLQPRVDPNELANQLVAAIQSQAGSGVEFVALYDEASGEVRVTSLKGSPVPDKDYELWYIKGEQPAVSMGVIPMDQRMEIPLDAAARANIEPGTVFAVTLEQKGGSPTGKAQGPIVAVGTATPI
jgi:anti-sigma-K factor RskA